MPRKEFVENWGKSNNLQHFIVGRKELKNGSDDFESWSYDDAQTDMSVSSENSFGIASISKSFTALAVLNLCNDGLINIDDSVHKYIDLEQKTEKPIEIRHLLSHTSGRPNDHAARYMIEESLGEVEESVKLENYEDVLSLANKVPSDMLNEPGSMFAYYNTGYMLLGHLIEVVSGDRYEDYIRENLFDPIGMDDSYFANVSSSSSEVDHYFPKDDESIPEVVGTVFPRPLNPAGGVFSTLEDMLRYGEFLANEASINGNQILESSIFDSFYEVEVGNDGRSQDSGRVHVDSPVGVDTGDSSYMKGFEDNTTLDNVDVVGHHGDLGISESQVTITDSEVLVSLSTPSKGGQNLSNFNFQFLAYPNPDEGDSYEFFDEVLNRFEGKYKAHIPNYEIEVENNGSYLSYESNKGLEGILIPSFEASDSKFYEFIEPSDTGRYSLQHIKDTGDGFVLYLDRNAFQMMG